MECAKTANVLADPRRCCLPEKPALVAGSRVPFELDPNRLNVNELADG